MFSTASWRETLTDWPGARTPFAGGSTWGTVVRKMFDSSGWLGWDQPPFADQLNW